MNRVTFSLLAALIVAGLTSKPTIAIAEDGDSSGQVETSAASAAPVPTEALVRITAKPEAARILLDGEPLDVRDPAKRLAFGEHEIRAEGKESGWARWVGSLRFSVATPQDQTVPINLEQRERRYRGRWLPQDEALRLEEADYRAARIDRPIALKLAANDQALKSLRAGGLSAEQLHAVLRIGDRIDFRTPERSWLVWKRHEERDAAFNEAVAALLAGRQGEQLFKDHGGMLAAEAALKDAGLPALAFALHGARNKLPHLDLGGNQLGRNGESIARVAADGALTILARADGRFGVQGLPLKKIGDLYVGVAPPGNDPIRIEWDQRPQRLLVIADKAINFGTDKIPDALQIGEKRVFGLARDRSVDALVRISSGPDYEGARREDIRREGPLAAQIDLAKDEVGPNKAPGDYQRIWLVTLAAQEGATQRQISARYKVTSSEKDVKGDAFLRHGAPRGK